MAASAQSSVGDPINPATGDLHESSTDLSLPGPGVPAVFTRSYDAQAAQAEVVAGVTAPALGYGWSDNLGMSLAYNSGTQTATVTEENGAQVTFGAYVSGTSPAWCSGTTNFCATAPRVEATLIENSGGTWTFARTVGTETTFTFTSSGVLTSIADTAGDTLTSSTYAPTGGQTACPTGTTCVGWTSSASGRELVVADNGSGRLTSVFDANSTLAATFAYTGSGCTTWGGSETADLCLVTDPGSITTTYTYDAANSTASFDYDLLSETPPGATVATANVYDTSGRVIQQTDPSGAVTTLSYAGTNAAFLGGTTTVTDYPLGTGSGKPQNVTGYQYSSNVLISKTTGTGGLASTQVFQRDPVSLLPLSVQDGDGNVSSSTYQTYSNTGGDPVSSGNDLTSTDPAGNTVEHAYNGFNQAWCTVDAADYANGTVCPSTAPTAPPTPGSSDSNLGMTISFYNSSDQLTATTDALGNTTVYAYTSAVAGVPNGLVYCTVDPASYQKSVTCPAYSAAHVTGTATTTFDSAGDTTSTTDPDGNTTTSVYAVSGHPGLISSQTDPDGTTTTYAYDGTGQVTSQVATFGSYTATTLDAYDSLGRPYCEVASAESAKGVTCPTSPPTSAPTPGSDPYPGATITTYDANGRAIQSTNPLGGITYTAYDSAGEAFCRVAAAEAAVGVTCPTVAPSTAPTVGADAYLGATITTYDGNGRPVQVTNPLGGITLDVYDPANNLVQTTVESNNGTAAPNVVTARTYDADDRVVSTTVDPGTALASTTAESYDPNGDVFCSVSANAEAAGSSAWQCPVWQAGWIVTPPSPTTLYSSTPSSAQADDVTTAFSNADGEEIQTTNPDVETSVMAVDADGRTFCTSDPTNVGAWLAGHSSGVYPYLCPSSPPLTAPATGSNPGFLVTIFDPAGRTVSSTDQAGDTTSYTYAPAGQVLTTTDPRGKVSTDCYYYQHSSCASSAPAGGGSGEDLYSAITPVTAADPTGEVTTAMYYPGGETELTATPAGVTTDAYDPAGDLASVVYSATANGYTTPTNLAYTYNVDGTRHSVTDGTGTTTYAYDPGGDVTSEVLAARTGSGLANTTTSYGYFTTGTLASVTYPAYGGQPAPTVTYRYDPTGAMAAETDWLGDQVTFAHDTDGNPTGQDNNVSVANPNGTSSTASSYDNADENTQAVSTVNQTCGGAETLTQAFAGMAGSRNADGQVTQDLSSYTGTCSGQTSYQRDYSYDVAGRVVYQGATVQGSNPNTFAYDPSGDVTTLSSHDSAGNFDTYTQTYDAAGEVTAQAPVSGSGGLSSSYAYDTLGDQTVSTPAAGIGTSATYDQAQHLTAVAAASTPSSPTATYTYNGDGLRVGVTTPVRGSGGQGDGLAVLAGTGTAGAPTAGPAVSSKLDHPRATAIDSAGDVYIADATNQRIEKVSPAGTLSVFAGTGTAGAPTAGAATSSELNTPEGIALDGAGNVYIADYGNNRVEKVTAAGTLSIVAGTGTAGAPTPGAATSSKLNGPVGVAVDGTGNLYIGDYNNNRVEKVTPTGTLSVFAGTGTAGAPTAGAATSSKLSQPEGVAVDTAGNVYIADASNNMVEKVTPTGTLSVFAGTGTAGAPTVGAATSSKLSRPQGVAVDSAGNVYIADYGNNMVETVNPAGTLSVFAGTGTAGAPTAGAATSSKLNGPLGVAVDTAGNVYIADYANHQVEKLVPVVPATATLAVAAGTGTAGAPTAGPATSSNLDHPRSAAIDSAGNVYIADATNNRVEKVTAAGVLSVFAGTGTAGAPTAGPATSSKLSTPEGVAVDSAGNVYIGDYGNNTVDKVTPTGTLSIVAGTGTAGTPTPGPASSSKLNGPVGVAVDSAGNLYIGDYNNNRVEKVTTTGTLSVFAGTGTAGAPTAGAATSSELSQPEGVAVDTAGNVYIADASNNMVEKVTAGGTLSVFAGTGTAGAPTAGAATSSKLSRPQGVAVDSAGNVYIADYGNNMVETVTPTGTLAVAAGTGPAGTPTAGAATNSELNGPLGVAVDSAGNVYIADYANQRIEKLAATTTQLTWGTATSLPDVLSDSTNDYIYGPSATPVEQIALSTSTPTYLTYTPSDSTWISTNQAGDQTGFWGYDAFGTLAFGTPTSPFGYSGQYVDATTGLVNDRARNYQPQTGGFLTVDPDVATTDAPYTYASDDPVNLSDPTGLNDCGIFGAVCDVGHVAAGAARYTNNTVLPVVHTVSSVVSGAAGACALIAGASIIGDAGVSEACGAVAVGAAGAEAATGAILYGEGRESTNQFIGDEVSFGLGGAGYGLSSLSTSLGETADAYEELSNSSGLFRSLYYGFESNLYEIGSDLSNFGNYLIGIPTTAWNLWNSAYEFWVGSAC